MAIIKPFQAPELGLRPSEEGVQAFAAAGRRLGAFSNQVAGATEQVGHAFGRIGGGIAEAGQAVTDIVTHQQVSHGAATFAQLTDSLTNRWNDIAKNADPN